MDVTEPLLQDCFFGFFCKVGLISTGQNDTNPITRNLTVSKQDVPCQKVENDFDQYTFTFKKHFALEGKISSTKREIYCV